ncbi:MAG TPA: zf-HC2 domain-containing protein [Candidatus Sulfotelmatobacter sp.]|nr:zf-HC2 domain-containing protein [Candidatus Sulfotelmatobacter sp.]
MTSHYDRDTLIDYQHRALDPDADAAVFAHLETCADCLALHDEEAALGERLRALAGAQEREFPSLIKARVWDAVRRERPSVLARLHLRWGPALAVPVAAAFILGVYFGTPVFRGSVPGVAATFYLDEHSAETQDNPLGQGAAPAIYETAANHTASSSAASYIDSADAATLDDAVGADR